MITETTAISCAAFGALSTGLGISAGIGWIRCARMLKIARDTNRSYQHEFLKLHSAANKARAATEAALDNTGFFIRRNAELKGRLHELEYRLRQIEQSRHASAKHARAAQIAQRKEAITATTNQLQREVAERAEPARIAA